MTPGRSRASALLQRAARCVEHGICSEAAAGACTTSGRPWTPGPAAEGPTSHAAQGLQPALPGAHNNSLRALNRLGSSTSSPASASSSSSSCSFLLRQLNSRSFASSSAAAGSAAPLHPSQSTHAAAAQSLSQAAAVDPATMLARGQLLDSLSACLGLQHLDSLLAREEHKALIDEMLLLAALDVAFRLCSSGAAAMPQLGSGSQYAGQEASQQQPAALGKSGADAASDVLTRLSEVFIQLLSTPGGLSPEGAVRALRTLAMLRFNPAGDYTGLKTVSAYFRDVVLPALEPDPAAAAAAGYPPDLAVRAPQLLTDVFFAFARLFELAARRERELLAQLESLQLQEEEERARREADLEAAEDGSSSGSSSGGAQLPPWGRVPRQQLPEELRGGAGSVVGDRQLYDDISHKLHGAGNPLQLLPSRSLGALATAMATSRYLYYPLAMAIAHAVVVRLQTSAPALAPPGGAAEALSGVGMQDRADAIPASTLSNIMSCLSKSGFEAEALCDAAAHWLTRHMGRAGPGGPTLVAPHHIVDVAAAFARVKYENYDFLCKAADALTPRLPNTSPAAVSTMVWAVANSKAGRDPYFVPLLNALAYRLVVMHRNSRSSLRSALPAAAVEAGGSGAGSGGGGGGGAQVVPRHLATAVFAMGRLGLLQPVLMECVAGDVVSRPDSYTSRQLANVLRAFTLLDCYRPDMFAAACGQLQDRLVAQQAAAAAAGLLPSSPELQVQVPPPLVFSPQNYSDIAWGVALAGHGPQAPELMQLLADRITEAAPRLGKACLVRAAQAFAVAGVADPRVYQAITESTRPLLADLGPTYLATLADAVAEVQAPVSEAFWLACMQAAAAKVEHLQRTSRADMQSAAARLLRAFRRHPATAAYASTRDHYVIPQLEQLLSQPAAY